MDPDVDYRLEQAMREAKKSFAELIMVIYLLFVAIMELVEKIWWLLVALMYGATEGLFFSSIIVVLFGILVMYCVVKIVCSGFGITRSDHGDEFEV